jgi:transcriptional regulator
MYRPVAYAVDDPSLLHSVMRQRSFATLAAVVEGELLFAYAPVVLDDASSPLGTVRFHLARANPMAELDGAQVHLSFIAGDAYVSPDWYQSQGLVPTWNYVAIEAAGRARRLDENALRALLADLSAVAEVKLRPKRPWTIDKLSEERIRMLLNAIRGFSVTLERLHGKFKLSQDKRSADIAAVIAALEARGDAGSLSTARAMNKIARGGVEKRK